MKFSASYYFKDDKFYASSSAYFVEVYSISSLFAENLNWPENSIFLVR